MRSDPTLLHWYKLINKRFFDGACSNRACIRWASKVEEDKNWEDKYFGWATLAQEDDKHHDYQIVMSRKMNTSWVTRISTLVHEMIHLATNLKDDHGPVFEKWRTYVSNKGIFKKHALKKNNILF